MKFSAIGFTKFLIIILLCLTGSGRIFAQAHCLSSEEAQKAVSLLDSPQAVSPDKSLRQELLDMKAAELRAEQKVLESGETKQDLIGESRELSTKNLLRVCEIIKQNGWTDKKIVGDDGFAAALFIINNGGNTELQKEIFPVLAAAAKKGLVGNSEIAPLIDNIRVGQGLPQIFGSQAKVKDDLMYLYPLFNDAKVDEYRKLYGLPPLSNYIKYLQFQYGMPVIKSPRSVNTPQLKQKDDKSQTDSTAPQSLNLDQEEVVKVESNVVSLNARIFSNDAIADLNLQKADFALFQDGKPQEISFFSSTDAPFDLVLVLDLSGSTAGKRDLIRQSTKRFIEAARPSDRIAILTFTDQVKIISHLTQDKKQLLEAAKKIGDNGGSAVWLGLQTALDQIVKTESSGRRSAVVMMTDGVDSSLVSPYILSDSYPNFSDLLETVRDGNTTVIPIYLDTEKESDPHTARAYRAARRTLSMLAEESGGEIYYAKKIENLEGVYEKVISDLGKVYSLGYEPSEITRDGAWHTLEIKIPSHPNLTVRAKTGFYAK